MPKKEYKIHWSRWVGERPVPACGTRAIAATRIGLFSPDLPAAVTCKKCFEACQKALSTVRGTASKATRISRHLKELDDYDG